MDAVEPMSGFEPLTYSLRMSRLHRLSWRKYKKI